MIFIDAIINWYSTYKDNKKWKEFYAKLDRNAVKFTMKDYRKSIHAAKKKELARRKNIQDEINENKKPGFFSRVVSNMSKLVKHNDRL